MKTVSGVAITGILLASAIAFAAPDAPPLEGRDWRLVGIQDVDASALAVLPHAPTIRFEAGHLHGFDGCNSFAGGYEIAGDELTLGPLAGTLMACGSSAAATEASFRQALSGTLRFSVEGDRLSLASAEESAPRLVFALATPSRLEGVDWVVTGFNNGRQAVVSPLLGSELDLRFEAGAIVGHAGCNSFRANYTLEDQQIAIGPVVATRRTCADADVMAQERAFLAAVASATRFAIDPRGLLDMHRADDERVLTAHRRAGEPTD